MIDMPKGLETFHVRAESWECDIHRHWSTRFYCRTFERATENCFLLTGLSPPRDGVEHRHLRFHSEVLESDAVRVETYGSRKAEPESIVHCMFRRDTLVATARDEVDCVPACLPELPEDYERLVNARGLRNRVSSPWQPDTELDFLSVLGAVRPEELGGRMRGRLPMDEIFRRSTYSSLHHIAHIGFSSDFTRKHHIGRMVAELRYQGMSEVEQGQLILGASRLIDVSEKSFVTSHMLSNNEGRTIAIFDICSLAVDLEARKVCSVPKFLKERMAHRL